MCLDVVSVRDKWRHSGQLNRRRPPFFSSSRSSLLWTDYCSKGKKCAKNKRNCKDSFPPRGNNKKRTDKDFFFSNLTVVVVFFNWIVKISEKTLCLAEMTKWYCFMYTWKMRDNLESFEFRKQPLLLASFCTNFGYKTRMGAYLSQLLFAYIGNLFLRFNGKESSFTSRYSFPRIEDATEAFTLTSAVDSDLWWENRATFFLIFLRRF